MKAILFSIVLIFFTSGCNPTYVHPTKDSQDFERDRDECEKIAAYMAKEAGQPDNLFFIENECMKCMELKFGWKPKK